MKRAIEKKRVLFICTHNSSRSQMAEGLLNYLYGTHYEAYSAGTAPSMVNPYAIKVMREIGIDISNYRSKNIKEFRDRKFDYVVTVCDHAQETCPFYPGALNYIHMGFRDPSAFIGNEDDTTMEFRQVRDEIKEWIEKRFGDLVEQANRGE
ncbi:MAG: Glutaredoxin arsenate reductase [candidate division WS2 bacterium]|uniref:Glutaredoxin arsenate reductase n=1 Tax=Psychracetigena formicireducens TaxID=2986056 RepID=A0A9E2F721_PSYF1|nr:Glutaredoxin arsenate reductase [Candidatus Psychracetigena formicireducens]MBT9145138.1 Glutaredoxin arsenate reductase [Candidatus Psychracetigena formicireducens]MBT9150777.1 Glutaredoxin arsenate reductase [Candidatus Psychracetigena formicireducens]